MYVMSHTTVLFLTGYWMKSQLDWLRTDPLTLPFP